MLALLLHLLWDRSLTSVSSPSPIPPSVAHPLHAILALSSTSTSAWRPMLEASAALLSTTFTTSAGSAIYSISRQQRQSSRPSSSPAWTAVTRYCTDCHLHSWTGCRECRTRLPGWWSGQVDGRTSHRCFCSSNGFRAVPHHLQDPLSNLPCVTWPCPSVYISDWVAGPLPTISGPEIRRAAASPRSSDQAAHLWGEELCLRCPKAVKQSAVQDPGSCQPGRLHDSPQNLPFRTCLQPPPRNQWQLILTSLSPKFMLSALNSHAAWIQTLCELLLLLLLLLLRACSNHNRSIRIPRTTKQYFTRDTYPSCSVSSARLYKYLVNDETVTDPFAARNQ